MAATAVRDFERPKAFYRLEAVFERAQVDPLPPPAVSAPRDLPIAPITGDTLAWTLPVLDALAGELDITIGWEPMAEGHDGFYQPGERRIALNQAITVNQQAAALAHALVRLDHHDDVQQLDCATEELVAESVAYTVCGFLGLDTAGNSIPYLAVWSEHTDADAFGRIAALVDRLARRLEEALQPDAAEGDAGSAINGTA